MKKILFTVILLVCSVVLAFSQSTARKPVLAVLPFYGGEPGEGETIATLLANEILRESAFMNNFEVVSRTGSALEAIFSEHNFQMTGYTDSDTVAGIGRLLNARYVLSGSISKLGNRNLLIATVIHVETYEQTVGLYQTYRDLMEIQGLLPAISKKLATDILQQDTSKRNSLAIVPFDHLSGISAQDTETLTQILTIEILNTGKYVMLPRTSTIQAAMDEQKFQTAGMTEEEGYTALGKAVNADYVLSGKISRLGSISIFVAQILRVQTGTVLLGTSRNYNQISDGIFLMEEIAILLTDPENAEARITALNLEPGREERNKFLEGEARRQAQTIREREAEEKRLARESAAEEKRQIKEAKKQERRDELESTPFMWWLDTRRDYSIRSELEHLSLIIGWQTFNQVNYGGGIGSSIVPFLLPSGTYWSPAPFIYIGLELKRLTFKDFGNPIDQMYYSIEKGRFLLIAPAIGLVLSPFDNGRFFTNFLLEMGQFQAYGLWGLKNGISPGFAVGFIFDPPGAMGEWVSFSIKYRYIFLRDNFSEPASTQAIDIGAIITFEALKNLFGLF